MKKRTIKILVGIAVGLIISCAVIYLLSDAIGKKSAKIDMQNNEDFLVSYEEHEVSKKTLGREIRANGTIVSLAVEKLSLPEGALITKKHINNGDKVVAKQLLITFKTSEGEYKNIYASFNGVYAESGEDGAQLTYQVYGTDQVGLRLTVNENNISKITLNQKAQVYVSAIDKTIEGTVVSITPMGTDGKFTFNVKIPYSDELRFGYSASAQLLTESGEEKVVVPTEAVFYDNNDTSKQFVVLSKYKKDIEKLSDPANISEEYRTYIKTNATDNTDIEIIEGVNAGEKILMPVYGG